MSDLRSLATLNLSTTRYVDFYVPILLEKLPAKLLINILKEYPCANSTIDQLIEVIRNEVKRLEQVAYINNQPSNQKPPSPSTSPSLKVPNDGPLNDHRGATALSATVRPSDQSKPKKLSSLRDQRRSYVASVGSKRNTFQCQLSVEDRMSAVKSKEFSLIVSEVVMPLQSVSLSLDVQCAATTSHYITRSFSFSISCHTSGHA